MMEEKRPEEREKPDPSQLNGTERFYENFRNVPIRCLDIFIGLCIAALIAVLAMGYLTR